MHTFQIQSVGTRQAHGEPYDLCTSWDTPPPRTRYPAGTPLLPGPLPEGWGVLSLPTGGHSAAAKAPSPCTTPYLRAENNQVLSKHSRKRFSEGVWGKKTCQVGKSGAWLLGGSSPPPGAPLPPFSSFSGFPSPGCSGSRIGGPERCSQRGL